LLLLFELELFKREESNDDCVVSVSEARSFGVDLYEFRRFRQHDTFFLNK
jgi:hypothetical protein